MNREPTSPETSAPADSAQPIRPPAASPNLPPTTAATPLPPPRPITATVRRRSWQEPPVRFWWLTGAVLLAIGAWFVVQQILESQREQVLINIPPIPAVIQDVGGETRKGAKFPPSSECSLSFQIDGRQVVVSGVLAWAGDFVSPGQTVMIHVNPLDPAQWTDRIVAQPIAQRMVAGAIILPAAAAAVTASILLRRRVLRSWQNSPAVAYSAVDARPTALAPMCRAVRCVAAQGADRGIVTVYLPSRLGAPAAGDTLWLVYPPGKPSAAVAAAAYQ